MKLKEIIRKKLLIEYTSQKIGRHFINETILNGKTIINVDIQPEYADYITFDLNQWINFLNKNNSENKIVFLYNGADTLGMISKSDYIYWLYELGLNEDVLNNAIFYDKGYAFFRYCMDNNIPEDTIVNLIKFMNNNNISDSRDFDIDLWNRFAEEYNEDDYGVSEIRELLEEANDCINIPDLMEFIKKFSNIILTGGGINECLKEVELSLLALEKPYNVLKKFTY